MNNPAKIGLVGCGNVAAEYVENLSQFPLISVISCFDTVIGRANKLARRFGLRAARSFEEMLADPQLDIILNLTSISVHADVTLRCLSAGKHVYSEKPLASDGSHAGRILRTAAKSGLRVGCAPDIVLGTPLRTAQDILARDGLGRIIGACAVSCSPGPEQWHEDARRFYVRGAGPLFDMGPYYLTALVHLLGPARSATGLARRLSVTRPLHKDYSGRGHIDVEVATHVCAVIEFEGGPLATLLVSFDVQASEERLEVHGTSGSLRLRNLGRYGHPVELFQPNHGWSELTQPSPEERDWRGMGLAEMVAADREGRPHKADAQIAWHVVEILRAIEISTETGRQTAIPTSGITTDRGMR